MNGHGTVGVGARSPGPEPKPLDDRLAGAAGLLGVAAAGLLVVDPQGLLAAVAASLPAAHDLDILQLRTSDGPGTDAFRIRAAELNVAHAEAELRWPAFTRVALAAKFATVHAVPVLRAGKPIGVLTLYQRRIRPLDADNRHLAEILATALVATALQRRAMDRLRQTIDRVGLLLYQIDDLDPRHGGAGYGPLIR